MGFNLILLLLFSIAAFAQPIAPSENYMSRSKDKKDVKLPYTPPPLEDLEKQDFQDKVFLLDNTPESRVEWSKIPYIPSKQPQLSPAGDPKI